MATIEERIAEVQKSIEDAQALLRQLKIEQLKGKTDSYDLIAISSLYEAGLYEQTLPAGVYFIRYDANFPIELDCDEEFRLADQPDETGWISGHRLYLLSEV